MVKKLQSIDFQLLFESGPGLYLILLPDDEFKIAAVSDEFLSATMMKRTEMIGKNLFDVFPLNHDYIEGTEVYNLKSSLNKVKKK